MGLCVALGGCSGKFVAGAGTGGGGASGAAQGGAASAGAPAGGSAGGDNSSGAGADAGASASADAGEAGAEAGGAAGAADQGGSGGTLGSAGGATGGVSGGGTGGVSGGGGALIDPELPTKGLLVWLRADRGIQQKDGHVQVWQDQSGNLNNANQAGVSLRPAYLATGFNGRPTLEFDGQGQFLKFPDGFGDFSQGLTGFIVAKPSASECASMVELSNGSEIDDIALGMWQNKWTYEVEVPYLQLGSVDLERFSLYAVNHPPAGATELRIDGSTLNTLEMPVPVVPASGIRQHDFVGHTLYGGCNYFKGQISEIILYSRSLNHSELSAIEEYLDAHWALSEQDTPTP
jgi:hypothetical protein